MRKTFVLCNVRCFLHKDIFETNQQGSLNLETTDLRDFLTFSLNQKKTIKLKNVDITNKRKSYYWWKELLSYRKIEIK